MHPEVYGAAKSGEFHSLMRIILENGEDLLHQTTPKGNNVLHVAAQFGQANFIQEFLQDLSRSSLLWQGNCKGDTPLHVATQLGSHEMVRVFIDRAKAIHQPDAYKELLRIPNSDEDTLLHFAIRGRCKGVVELLIEEDPQLCDITNAADESPLYLAVDQSFSDIIELILCASSSPSSHKGPKGLTALHAAVRCPLPVQLLLQHDTSVAYDLDKEGDSALHIAAFQGNIDVIDKLVTSCPDAWDIMNYKRQTALHAAVIGGKVKVVKHILRMPNLEDLINEKDTDGNTALHLAMRLRKYESALTLARDKKVDHFATNKDHLTAVDILYDQKEEVTYRNFRVFRALRESCRFPNIQDFAVEKKKTLDKQFLEGQSAASITTGSNSSLKSIIDLELLVAAFIATATFAAAFALPGGNINDGPNQGMATLAGRAAFKTFVITNTIAFSFSTLALFLQFDTFALSDRRKVRFTVDAAACIYIAMFGMVLAFASGTYLVLTRTIGLAIVPWVICGCLGINYLRDPFSRFATLCINPSDVLPEAKARS
ncbi:serine/threonine-protein phosphatase 6 regulatory ankyrin repeat subunit B-like [Eucalyptus grandis]|uniref:serine/threonine-protein phosphatase 6 regulatory ankyrin repeat subunit B-like n=1 Tax=Eucalyptus grandis TaxID=71139 RepID=UPI00192EF925|nr:serine/threonine-protein phosphatase 6 regulatory ankyrin repeat subunit B-like [Eucalyptus grandis]